MITRLPDADGSVSLRPTRELSHVPISHPEAGSAAGAPTSATRDDTAAEAVAGTDTRLLGYTLIATAVAGIAGIGWMLERRHRLRAATEPSELQAEQRPSGAARPGVPTAKKLMKLLLWLRTVGGAAAILAAIAIVVFWAIEFVDRSAREPGLNTALMIVLVVGWAVFWLSGRVVNMVHRSFFGRAHPIFAD